MRKNLLLIFVFLMSSIAVYATPKSMITSPQQSSTDDGERQVLSKQLKNLSLEDALNLTPKSYREMTGERLGLVKFAKLKVAQHIIKKQQRKKATDLPKGGYIALAIFGFGWLAMGLLDDFQGNNWWIGLILYAIFYFPGLIYSLIKMSEYY